MASDASSPFKLAIVGGGPAGWALAASALAAAKVRGGSADVTVFAPTSRSEVHPPAVLTPECRARLATLGAPIQAEWRAHRVVEIDLRARGGRERLSLPAGGYWVLDGALGGLSLVTHALSTTARSRGARRVHHRVDRVESATPGPTGAPTWVVWAQGATQRFHSVALAGGARADLGDRFFPGFGQAPTLPAVHAWLSVPADADETLHLFLSPCAEVDGLFLVPCGGRTYALAWGQHTGAKAMGGALVAAAREGLLPDGFRVTALERTRLPAGRGARLASRGHLALGAAAAGHPLQLGVSETLASARAAARALFGGSGAFEEGHVRGRARDGALAWKWLLRCGARAPQVLARARAQSDYVAPFNGGVLGMSSPTPRALKAATRRFAVGSWLVGLFVERPAPRERPALRVDDVYVLDDDRDSLQAICRALEARGSRARAFTDELSFFRAVDRRSPRAILIDVVLEWVDGLRLCAELKRHDRTRDIPVLVMSGLDQPQLRERALAAGASVFLPKPLDLGALWQKLDALPVVSGRAPLVESRRNAS